MNAQNWFPASSGVNGLRSASHLHKESPSPARVALFGSFMGGYHVLSELLFGELADRVTVVGVATDDPTQPYTNAKVRLWKYRHTPDDEMIVRRLAAAQKLPVFTGRVKSPEFHELMLNEWRPDLCLMATFGQKVPNHIIPLPRLGFYNFHHSGPTWPSYPGPDPIAAMLRDGRKDLVLTMHKVSDVIDDGEFAARSHPVTIPPGINAIEMHRITWPQMHGFIGEAVSNLLDAREDRSVETDSWTMHEDHVPYFARDQPWGGVRARRLADDCMAGLRL
jgi:methionyl-tRNA formyltransferase